MNIFATPISSKISFDNYIKSVINVVNIYDQEWRIWGLKKSKMTLWSNIKKGDKVLFYSKQYVISYCEILEKQSSNEIAIKLWGSFTEYQSISTWPLLIYLSTPISCKVPFLVLNKMMNYSDRYVVQSFSKLRESFMDKVASNYGDFETFIKKESIE